MISVCGVKKRSAVAEDQMERPTSKVNIFNTSFCRERTYLSVTPLSFIRFPSISIPINAPAVGTNNRVTSVTHIGKSIFCLCVIRLGVGMTITRSFAVTNALIIGGWMNGTKAIYEKAAIATEGSNSGARRVAVKMDVGPSELPMIPMEAASFRVKPSNPGMNGLKRYPISKDIQSATKIPSCPPSPINALLGEDMRGPKSVMLPIHRKINGG